MKNDILKKYFNYSKLKKEQEEIIDSILNKNDTIGLLPTGYGKSMTFIIPALIFDGITIVISPLIALMQDQVNNLKKRGINAEFINSLISYDEQIIVYNKILNNKIKLLFVAGERLLSYLFLKTILKINISLIVCDEAHTLLWSEDFRYSLKDVSTFISRLPIRPPLLALTATATSKTVNKIINIMGLNNPNIIKINPDRLNIYYRIIHVHNKDKVLLKYLSNHKNKTLIYCLTIKNVLHVYELLKANNLNVGLYHGSLDSDIKKEMLDNYTNNKIDIMVSTNAFGMGIDCPNIRYVIEYDIPISIEDFQQQTGRASRDGMYAEGVLLFNIKDLTIQNYFISNIKNDELSEKEVKEIKKDRYEKMDYMINLALTKDCIHKKIVNYFGFKHKGKCNMCSNCKKKS